MLKSFIQPLQRLIQGATGKDRQDKKQLTQQLRHLSAVFDDLQQDFEQLQQRHETQQRQCDRLKQIKELLKRDLSLVEAERDSLIAEHEHLKQDRDVVYKLIEVAEDDLSRTQQQLEHIEAENSELRQKNSELLGQVAMLQHELSLDFYQRQPPDTLNLAGADRSAGDGGQENIHASPLAQMGEAAPIDLSHLTLALVGGHDTSRREISTELMAQYRLKRCVEVPPHSVKSSSRQQIKEKISHCDLVVIIASHIDHAVSKSVMNLKHTGSLMGEVIRIDSHGKSGVIREILNHVTSSSR